MRTKLSTTGDLIQHMARVLDALADHDGDLPALGHISVNQWGQVRLEPHYRSGGDVVGGDMVRDVCAWAAAFGVPVVIDLSSSGAVVAVVNLGGVEARVDEYVSHRRAYEYGAALGIPLSPGGQAQVDAATLLAVLDKTSATRPRTGS